jgi:hypothetical protein
MSERVQYTHEQLREFINDKDPHDAMLAALTFMQRIAMALEQIAQSLEEAPAALFEIKGDEPTSDGLGVIKSRDDDDKGA